MMHIYNHGPDASAWGTAHSESITSEQQKGNQEKAPLALLFK